MKDLATQNGWNHDWKYIPTDRVTDRFNRIFPLCPHVFAGTSPAFIKGIVATAFHRHLDTGVVGTTINMWLRNWQ